MRYFDFHEFERSDTAARMKIDNRLPEIVEAHVVELVDCLLDPLREAWGAPIVVTSGYRCPALNKAVGGSETSAHTAGWAADLVPEDRERTEEFVKWAIDRIPAARLAFDQLIGERSGGSRWLHVGIRNLKGEQRREVKVYEDGRYITL